MPPGPSPIIVYVLNYDFAPKNWPALANGQFKRRRMINISINKHGNAEKMILGDDR